DTDADSPTMLSPHPRPQAQQSFFDPTTFSSGIFCSIDFVSKGPFPIPDFRHIFAVLIDIRPVLDQLVPQALLNVPRDVAETLNPVEHITREMKPVKLIEHRHIERCRGSAFFLVSPDMEIVVVSPAVCQPVNQPRIPVEREYNGYRGREDRVEIPI